MIRTLAEHRIAFALVCVLLLIQSFFLNLNDPWRKPINGDAQAYYAYLPAIFIYHDLEFAFVNDVQQKYYTEASAKSFLKKVDGETVNKTFPGIALLYLPFFLLAHGFSLLFGLPADGYAYTYQLAYLTGFWFYFLLGLIFFKKVLLKLKFESRSVDLTLVLLVLSTNVFFFSVFDQSVTHIYNFFLVNLFIYLALQLKDRFNLLHAISCLSILSLILIIRPTGILVLGLLLFFIPEKSFYKALLKELFRLRNLFKSILIPLLILFIPLILWKLQTGRWIVYSYGEEGFDFLHPYLLSFLFSYTKGWFTYTPMLLPIFGIGFYLLFKKQRWQTILGLGFLLIAVYVFSSWWCWYYGAGQSQRAMIDFYLLPGFLLALIIQHVQKKIRTYAILALAFSLLASFNIIQAYQIYRGILPFGSPTKEQYWDNFLVLQKRAQIYPQEHWTLIDEGTTSFNPSDHQILKGTPMHIGDEWILQTDVTKSYSAVIRIASQKLDRSSKIIFTFEAKAETSIEKTRVVFQLGPDHQYAFMLKDYCTGSWQKMQYLIEPNTDLYVPIDIYLWNADAPEKASLRNLSWQVFSTDQYF